MAKLALLRCCEVTGGLLVPAAVRYYQNAATDELPGRGTHEPQEARDFYLLLALASLGFKRKAPVPTGLRHHQRRNMQTHMDPTPKLQLSLDEFFVLSDEELDALALADRG